MGDAVLRPMTTSDADTRVQESIRAIESVPAPDVAQPDDLDLHDKSLYFGRELSWLEFNDRVLQLAENDSQPLLERVKLAAIWSSNLDEFFQIRVAGVHEQIDSGLIDLGPDGLTPSQTIDAIREHVLEQQQRLEDLVLGQRRKSTPSTASASSAWPTSPTSTVTRLPSAFAGRSSRR